MYECPFQSYAQPTLLFILILNIIPVTVSNHYDFAPFHPLRSRADHSSSTNSRTCREGFRNGSNPSRKVRGKGARNASNIFATVEELTLEKLRQDCEFGARNLAWSQFWPCIAFSRLISFLSIASSFYGIHSLPEDSSPDCSSSSLPSSLPSSWPSSISSEPSSKSSSPSTAPNLSIRFALSSAGM